MIEYALVVVLCFALACMVLAGGLVFATVERWLHRRDALQRHPDEPRLSQNPTDNISDSLHTGPFPPSNVVGGDGGVTRKDREAFR